MFSLKKTLLLIAAIPLLSATAFADSLSLPGDSQCGISTTDQVIPALDLSMISKFAYCSCGVKLENDPNYLEKDKEEADILEYATIDMAQCVSDVEKVILERKKELFKAGNYANEQIASSSGSFRYKENNLTFSENKRLSENKAGLNCGGEQGMDDVSCMKDLRTFRYKVTKDSKWLDKVTGSLGASWEVKAQGWLNFFISFIDYSFGKFSFGFKEFDSLPSLGYSSADMFNPKTIVGAINTFVLMILGFLIVFYFFNKTTERDGEDYKSFFIKVALILIVTVGFPSIYTAIGGAMTGMNDTIVDTLKRNGLSSIAVTDISMDRFGESNVKTLSPWIPVVLINMVILFCISIVIVIRNIFLYFVGYVFFLFAIGLIIGTMRKDNIMESHDVIGKTGKMLTEGLFWALSLFVSVCMSVFMFKITTIIFGTFPSMENGEQNMIQGINSLGIDTFFYFAVLIIIIGVWRYFLIDMTFSFISGTFKKLLFNDESGGLRTRDFYGRMSNAYDSIKTYYQDQRENNPWIIAAQRNFGSIVDNKSDSISQFVQSNSALQGLATAPGAEGAMEIYGMTKSVISDETSAIRRGLRTAVHLGTGIGSARSATKNDLKIPGFGIDIKGERTRILEETDSKIEGYKSRLSGDEEADRSFATQIRLLEEKKQGVIDGRDNERDMASIRKIHASALSYEKAIENEKDPEKKKLLQFKLEELLYKKKHGYENIGGRIDRDNLSYAENEIRKISIMKEHGSMEMPIDMELAVDEELMGLRASKEGLGKKLESASAKRTEELSEMEITKIEYEQAILKGKGIATDETKAQMKEAEELNMRVRIAKLEKVRDGLLAETENSEESSKAIDHDISAIKQYGMEKYGNSEALMDPTPEIPPAAFSTMELPPQFSDNQKLETPEEQPKIAREDDNIVRFMERYGKYRENAVSSGETDNIIPFGDDPIVGEILSEHFAETGDIQGIGEKIEKAFQNFSEKASAGIENPDGRIAT